MKVESINITALEMALRSTVGDDTTQFIGGLYAVVNEAMQDGYATGFEAGFKASEDDRQDDETPEEAYERGFDIGYDSGWDSSYDSAYDEGYFAAEHDYGVGEVFYVGRAERDQDQFAKEVQAALQANCAALDAEMQRLHDAAQAEDYYGWLEHPVNPAPSMPFDEYSRR